MNPQAPDPAALHYCSHRTPTGRRCHFPVFGNSALCSRHSPKYLPQAEADLNADFGKQLLSSPQRASNINAFLARLAILVVQNRISPRRAAVLAYVSNLLLRSLPEIDRENDTQRFPPKLAAPAVQSSVALPTAHVATTDRCAATESTKCSEVISDQPDQTTKQEAKLQKPN